MTNPNIRSANQVRIPRVELAKMMTSKAIADLIADEVITDEQAITLNSERALFTSELDGSMVVTFNPLWDTDQLEPEVDPNA